MNSWLLAATAATSILSGGLLAFLTLAAIAKVRFLRHNRMGRLPEEATE